MNKYTDIILGEKLNLPINFDAVSRKGQIKASLDDSELCLKRQNGNNTSVDSRKETTCIIYMTKLDFSA